MPLVPAHELRAVSQALFRAAGASEADASFLAGSLVESNLMGHDSHGVLRIPYYVQQMQKGVIDPQARPAMLNETATTALVDGNWTFGQVAARFATEVAIAKARASHVAAVGVVKLHHIGRLGEYAQMMADQGLFGMIVVGGPVPKPIVAPFGGIAPIFVTNPYAFGVPTGSEKPVLLDFATSVMAEGKVQVARSKGAALPPGVILDKQGAPSTTPEDLYDGGMLLTFGAHKGSGMALLADILASYLNSNDVYAADGPGVKVGAFILAVDIATFRPLSEFIAAVDGRLREVKAVAPAPGVDEVLYPGEPEYRSKAQRGAAGIPVPERTWHELRQTGQALGLDVEQLAPAVLAAR